MKPMWQFRSWLVVLAAALLVAPPAHAGFALYVSNHGNNSILKFDAAGNMTVFATNGVNGVVSGPEGLAMDNLGNLYVANNSSPASIEKYDPLGHGTTLSSGPFPLAPDCVAFDMLNNLLVTTSDSTVYRITNSLGQGSTFYPRNLSQLNGPYGMAFDNMGNLYVVNNGIGTVEEFAYPGTTASVFIPSVSQPVGIALDSAGNIYVSSYSPARVTKYNAQGTGGVTFGSGLSGPYGLAFDSAGYLYVADYAASAIYKFNASGTRTTFADSTKGLRNPEFIVIQEPGRYGEDWFKAAGGGGTSVGTGVSVSGTIGQHDAGALGGASASLSGGYWSLFAVQTPGAPLLTITHSGNQAVVSWPASVTGWTLQTNNNLASGTWGNYAGTVVNNAVTNSPPMGNLFFRLTQP